MALERRFTEILPEMTQWRRHFHRHPELMYDVHNTAAKISCLLRSFGCDQVVEGVGRTGVVGVIHGKGKSSERAIALRADMDALPISEVTGLEYASEIPGMMHACGHDGHMAMLLGAARYLCETRKFSGDVVTVFQPAEEGGAGAKAMIDDGLMIRFGINEVYGMHNFPGLPSGQFAVCKGSATASADEFEVIVTGIGGHAAQPHECIDATLIAAQIVVAFQTIVSRNIAAQDHVVISVAVMETDSSACNVLPQVARMKGTVRTMSAEVQDKVENRMTEIVHNVAKAFGGRAELHYRRGYPVLVNPESEAEYAIKVARSVGLGTNHKMTPMMWAEDFSFMLKERPGAYVFIGNGESAALHHPAYNFDDTALPYGAAWFAGMAEARLPLS